MKESRIFLFMIGIFLSMNVMAQQPLTDDGVRAQKALVDYLRTINIVPTIDTRDNSVCFKSHDVFFWVTFEDKSPVMYTIHRKPIKFDEVADFNASCARIACNEVNRKHRIKCTYSNKRVDFIMQTFAKEPSDFHGSFRNMIASFKDVDVTFKKAYDNAYNKWKEDSINENKQFPPQLGKSALKVSSIAFGNFGPTGNVISAYNQPLRKSECCFIKACLEISSAEKGIFKIGMIIINPDGKSMATMKGLYYCTTKNIEINKVNKNQKCELDPIGAETPDFWKAGEYKVFIYDFEKGDQIYTTTFNIL